MFIILGSCCGAKEANGQSLVWKVVFPEHDQRYHYSFTALSGYGESCTAAVVKIDDSVKIGLKVWQRFLRTDDAGLSWRELDPGLPGHKAQNTGSIFAVQMIDSLTIVAVGDSGMFLRSTDAGATWTLTKISHTSLHHVHFSDRLTGITSGLDRPNIFTTHDGGVTWDSTTVMIYGVYFPWGVESLGGDQFRLMTYGAGPFVYTYDSWRTIDSSRSVYDTSDVLHVITDLVSEGRDTIIAYGGRRLSVTDPLNLAALLRSTNEGKNWEEVRFPDSILVDPRYISNFDRPYMLTAGHGLYASVALSFDRGATWQMDSVVVDGLSPNAKLTNGAYVTPSGAAITIVQPYLFFVSGSLVRGTLKPSKVDGYERITYGTRIFPNPARTTVTITSPVHSEPVSLVDLLGREVRRTMLDASGSAKVDIDALPRGVYSVILRHGAVTLPVGRVAVIE